EAAGRLPLALAGCELAVVVGGGLSVQTFPGERDPVQRAVQLAVAAAVEPVASGRSARGLDRARASERGEGGLRAHPARLAAGDDQLCRADRPGACAFFCVLVGG